jgi:hypothetical protein
MPKLIKIAQKLKAALGLGFSITSEAESLTYTEIKDF